MKTAYFITATGTDIGKTWLCAALLDAAREQDLPLTALKPVQSGFDPLRPAASDAGVLLARMGRASTDLDTVAPWRFAAAMSPDIAARMEGRTIEFPALVDWCRTQIAAASGPLLIEGVGGVMVPLDRQHTVRDWIAALGLPTLLVTGTYLGALSHALTAVAALREIGIVPVAVVVDESPSSTVSLAETSLTLQQHLPDIPQHVIRRGRPEDVLPLLRMLTDGSATPV